MQMGGEAWPYTSKEWLFNSSLPISSWNTQKTLKLQLYSSVQTFVVSDTPIIRE